MNNSEWIIKDDQIIWYLPPTWPELVSHIAGGIGYHNNTITVYNSTVSSHIYKVSHGFSNNETIKGINSGTILTNFLTNIIKADTGQHLKVRKVADGTILAGSDVLSQGDTLIVVSSDSVNESKYLLDLTPLSHNAKLTSALYNININGNTGNISNFAYGTDLKTVLDGVVVPPNASIDVIDAQGAYVPMKMMNFDTVYQYVKVNNSIKFEVTAEDRTTKIVYQLQPNATDSDAFVTSNVYDVDNNLSIIKLIPDGTSVSTFKRNVFPAKGAIIKILDKNGLERTSGIVAKDDKILVTATNGITTKTYYFTKLCACPLPHLISKEYIINQIEFKISGKINETLTVGDFVAQLTPSSGASIKLCDKYDTEKASTMTLALGDVVKVVAEGGTTAIVVTYSVIFDPTSVSSVNNNKAYLEIYPNPSTGSINISGLEPKDKIIVLTALGKFVMERNVDQPTEPILMEDQPKGIYFIKIINKNNQEIVKKVVIY